MVDNKTIFDLSNNELPRGKPRGIGKLIVLILPQQAWGIKPERG
jgi:hypothetical protein